MEVQDPFADLTGMFEGPSQANHDDVYDYFEGRDPMEGR